MVIVAAGVAAGMLSHNINVFSLTGKITPGIPNFEPPAFSNPSINLTTPVVFEVKSLSATVQVSTLLPQWFLRSKVWVAQCKSADWDQNKQSWQLSFMQKAQDETINTKTATTSKSQKQSLERYARQP